MEAQEEPRLTIELVPKTCWFSNVRKQVPSADWNRIRKQIYASADHRCEVCGGSGTRHAVECHEVWEYDEQAGVQRLVRMVALCPACHEVKHIGLAQIKGRGDIAGAHLAEVNGWDSRAAGRYIDEAFAVWQRRSARAWSLDIAALAAYGIDQTVIAEAAGVSADDRSRAVAATAKDKASPPQEPLF